MSEVLGGIINEKQTWEEVTAVLQDCRRYLTEFGSVEPSALVGRINAALLNLGRHKDERCYLWQLQGVNGARIRRGETPLTYTQFLAGSDDTGDDQQ